MRFKIIFNRYFSVGIPFVIGNYRKGVFSALFRDRSGAVRLCGIPYACEKSSENALFSVRSIFAAKKSPLQVKVFARQTTESVLWYGDGSLTQQIMIGSPND